MERRRDVLNRETELDGKRQLGDHLAPFGGQDVGLNNLLQPERDYQSSVEFGQEQRGIGDISGIYSL